MKKFLIVLAISAVGGCCSRLSLALEPFRADIHYTEIEVDMNRRNPSGLMEHVSEAILGTAIGTSAGVASAYVDYKHPEWWILNWIACLAIRLQVGKDISNNLKTNGSFLNICSLVSCWVSYELMTHRLTNEYKLYNKVQEFWNK